MQLLDVLAAALVAGAAAAFAFGATALSRSNDIEAIYFLVVGVVALLWPELRRIGPLHTLRPLELPPEERGTQATA